VTKRIYFLSNTHFLAVAVFLRMMSPSHIACSHLSISCHCRHVQVRVGADVLRGSVVGPTPATSPMGHECDGLVAVPEGAPQPCGSLGGSAPCSALLVSYFLALLKATGMERGAVWKKSICCFEHTCEVPACSTLGFGRGCVEGMQYCFRKAITLHSRLGGIWMQEENFLSLCYLF